MSVHDMSIRTKILIGFFLVTLLVLLTGYNGYHSVSTISQVSTSINASKNMKLSVSDNLRLFTSILFTRNMDEVKAVGNVLFDLSNIINKMSGDLGVLVGTFKLKLPATLSHSGISSFSALLRKVCHKKQDIWRYVLKLGA